MADITHPPRIPPVAWLSLLLGLAALPLFFLGLPALVVGVRALRAINSSDGALRGARLVQVGLAAAVGGLALPALGLVAMLAVSAQTASRRVECANHLREIGLALNRYADAHGTFPPATSAPADLPPARRLSWLADVLPLLLEGTPRNAAYQGLAAGVDRRSGWDDLPNAVPQSARVGMFHCPAHPGPVTNATHYVGLAGVNPDAIDLPRDDPRAGVFGNGRGVKRQEVTAGISFTLMALETAHENGPWLAGGFPTTRGLDPAVERYSGWGRPFGGLHPGVVMALWVDASARPVSDSTPAELFRRQATIRRDAPP
ncbi:MAG: DUF1559 domain-containing protein [Gemmataceae bacterium]